MGKTGRPQLRPRTWPISDYLKPEQLQQMRPRAHVFVDSSTICAMVQVRAFAKDRGRDIAWERLEARMTMYAGDKQEGIFFGQFVKMSINELDKLFGGVGKVPLGTVRKTNGKGCKKTKNAISHGAD